MLHLALRNTALAAGILAALLPLALRASQAQTALSASQNLWSGQSDGVSVTEDGILRPGIAFGKGVTFQQTPLCMLAIKGKTYIGTGPSGDLLEAGGEKATVVHSFSEPLVTALARSANGGILVGTSTPGHLYLVDPGSNKVKLLAKFDAQYIWAISATADGIFVATGSPGKVFLLHPGKSPELYTDLQSEHVRSLYEYHGRLWAGTSGPAAIYELGKTPGAVLAASFSEDEVAAMASSGGKLYAAVNKKPDSGNGSDKSSSGGAVLYVMTQSGGARPLYSFSATILSMAPAAQGVYIGTKDGALFQLDKHGLVLAARWRDAPVAAVCSATGGAVEAAAASPGTLYRTRPGKGGWYVSPVIDAGGGARLGRVFLSGSGPVQLEVRGGNSPKPDPFWAGWRPADDASSLSHFRYFQWKLVFKGPAGNVTGVTLVYRPQNRPPVFESAEVKPPGEIYVKNASQIGDRLVQNIHDQDRPFPSIMESRPTRTGEQIYYLYGFRRITWKVEDPDGDQVRVRIEFRPERSGPWMTLAKNITDPFYVFDARTLPDGTYQVKLVADDGLSNPESREKSASQLIPAFVVDNTAPTLHFDAGGGRTLVVNAADNTGVQALRYSMDGKQWTPVEAEEGRFGARHETFRIPLPASGPHFLAVEAVDAYGNMAVKGYIQGAGAHK